MVVRRRVRRKGRVSMATRRVMIVKGDDMS